MDSPDSILPVPLRSAATRASILEGTAAHGMHGAEQGRWVNTQETTFRNWVNEQLRESQLHVDNFSQDFCDGVKLCALVAALRGGRKLGRVVTQPFNNHQKIENASLALKAMAEDKIKLVNIGPGDVVSGNVKLILGAIWGLILRYQIGKSKLHPKNIMLAWIQAVIPECNVTNFTKSWNDGKALHALIDFCQPGLSPNWRNLSSKDAESNCESAINTAHTHFGIPKLVSGHGISSPKLDAQTAMTYLSYFMKVNSPGFKATLERLNKRHPAVPLTNFSTDWMDGAYLCSLVNCVGGKIADWPNIPKTEPILCTQLGLDAAKDQLGVNRLLSAEEITDTQGDHLGVMAYAAAFINLKESERRLENAEKLLLVFDATRVVVGQKHMFKLRLLGGALEENEIKVKVMGLANHSVPVNFHWDVAGREAEGFLLPNETGVHKLEVTCNGELIKQCPIMFAVGDEHSSLTVIKKDLVNLKEGTMFKVTSSGSSIEGKATLLLTSPSGQTSSKLYSPSSPAASQLFADFSPDEIGLWGISLSHGDGGENITGSPFSVHVIDPTKVTVHDLQGGVIGQEISFLVDTSLAGRGGELDCVVDYHGRIIPSILVELRGLDEKRHRASFMPKGAGLYKIRLTYGGFPCTQDPFSIEIANSNMVAATGDGLTSVTLGHGTSFDVYTKGAGDGELSIHIADPSGAPLKWEKQFLPASESHHVQYAPRKVGDHVITLTFAGKHVKGSPFLVSVCNPLKCLASVPKTGHVGQPVDLEIIATEAGKGSIEILVNKGRVLCSVKSQGNKCYLASFVPEDPGQFLVEMNFNSISVPGSPWNVDVSHQTLPPPPHAEAAAAAPISLTVEETSSNFQALAQRAPVGEKRYFEVSSKEVEVQILAPTVQPVPYSTKPTVGGGVAVEYTFKEIGQHTVHIQHSGKHIKGSPFVVEVYDPSRVRVGPVPHGLTNGQRVEVPVDTRECGMRDGELEVVVEEGRVACELVRLSAGVYRAVFTATNQRTLYNINVFFCKILVEGSPFLCHTSAEEMSSLDLLLEVPKHLSMDQPQYAVIYGSGIQAGQTAVKITAPNGELVSSQLTTDSSNQVRVEYQSPYVGSHTVDIFYAGSKMGGSPYTVDVFDLNRVTVRKLNNIDVGQETEITVLSRSSGTSDVECRIVDPSGHTIPFRQSTTSEGVSVWYTPIQEGLYTVHVYVGGVEIPASPLSQSVRGQDPPSSPLKPSVDPNRITVEGEGLFQGQKGRKAPIIVHLHGSGAAPQLDVQGPASSVQGGGNVWTSVEQVNEEVYQLFYTPNQVGQFSVSIKWGGTDIPGSPFEPRVTDPGAVKVVNGLHNLLDANGQLPLVVGQICHIAIDAVEAGPGSLRAVFKDSSGNQVRSEVKKSDAGMYMINFTPPSKGEYTLAMYWNNVAVPGKALRGYARDETPLSSDKVAVSGAGLTAAIVGHTAEFILDGSKIGSGQPTLSLKAVKPGDPDIHVQSHQHSRGVYMCSYVPTVHGLYDLNLGWGHRQLEGSPRRVVVNAPPQARKVTMDTEQWATSPGGSHSGRRGGKVMMRLIDTNLAGPGELVARCSGPTQRALCKLETRGDGTYSLTVKPAEGGLHRLEVTYSGEHIPGSPHEFIFEPPFDPSRVMVSGPGVRHGILAAFQSQFRVDTKEAGGGNLTVKVRGPKGSFKVVMEKESERSIVCSYDPSEVGLYIVSVQWSGESVPGSPFYVHIFDTYEELSIYEKSGQVPQPLVNGRGPPNGLSLKKPRGRSLYNMAPPPLMSSLPLVGPGGLSPPSHRVPYQQHPQLNRQRAATTVRTGPSPRFGY